MEKVRNTAFKRLGEEEQIMPVHVNNPNWESRLNMAAYNAQKIQGQIKNGDVSQAYHNIQQLLKDVDELANEQAGMKGKCAKCNVESYGNKCNNCGGCFILKVSDKVCEHCGVVQTKMTTGDRCPACGYKIYLRITSDNDEKLSRAEVMLRMRIGD